MHIESCSRRVWIAWLARWLRSTSVGLGLAKVYMCYSILGLARYSAAGFQIGEFNTSITRSQLRVPPKYSIRIQRSTNVGLPPTDDANMCGERERLLSGKA